MDLGRLNSLSSIHLANLIRLDPENDTYHSLLTARELPFEINARNRMGAHKSDHHPDAKTERENVR